MKSRKITMFVFMAIFGLFMFVTVPKAFPHCDTMDGPVLTAAKEALKTGNVNLVLMWVQKDDEKQIKELFDKTMKLRKQGGEVQELADMYFFENFVRIHRAGEGAPYTGIKPAGEVEVSIAAADKAIEKGNIDDVLKMLNEQVSKGVQLRFKELMEKKNYDKNKPDEGREYVEKYVLFIHYVEGIFKAAEIESGCPHHKQNAESAEGSGACKHNKQTEVKPGNEQTGNNTACSAPAQSCDHVTHIMMILTILNFLILIFVIFKVRKIK